MPGLLINTSYKYRWTGLFAQEMHLGNSTVTGLQIRDFGLLFNQCVLYSYNLSQFEYF